MYLNMCDAGEAGCIDGFRTENQLPCRSMLIAAATLSKFSTLDEGGARPSERASQHVSRLQPRKSSLGLLHKPEVNAVSESVCLLITTCRPRTSSPEVKPSRDDATLCANGKGDSVV